MKIIESIQYNNDCYRAGRKIKVRGLMLHSVGCSQPKAEVFVKNWNKSVGVGVHAFIDGITGNVYQCLPWDHRAWHCGDQANNTHIGVEMCEPDCIKYVGGSSFYCTDYPRAMQIIERTYKSAVELFAWLCIKYGLNPMTDIISHKEGHDKGIASDHGDPEHLWQGLGTGFTMDAFRLDVSKLISAGGTNIPTGTKDASETKFGPYRVVITADVLNVRSGPGTDYPVVTKVKQNDVYTIVDEQNGWGKLKSGAGWICLDYTKKL